MIASNAPGPNLVAGLNLLKIPPECWRPFESVNARKLDRVGEREIERLPAWLGAGEGQEWIPVKIRDYSLKGFGILCQQTAGWPAVLAAGKPVILRIGGLGDRKYTIPCELRYSQFLADGIRLGLERTDSVAATDLYRLKPESRMLARIANPVFFNEWGEAHLVGFGERNECLFESEDLALLLFRDLPVRVQFELPLETEAEVQGSITWIRTSPDRRVTFGVRWTEMTFPVSNALGEHLLQVEGLRPADLAGFGVQLRRFRDQLDFSVVSTREEYAKVLALRHEAYVAAGKVPRESTPEQLATRLDGRSRILAAFHESEVIACVGLTFPRDASDVLRSESEFPGSRYPVRIPPKEKLIEVHSLCTHMAYRGGDVVRGIFEQVARCLLLSDRDWLITFSTPELWPLYRKIGFKKTGASAPIKALGGKVHHLILLRRDALICGAGMTPFAWNYFFGNLVRDLLEKRYLEPTLRQGIRLRWSSAFSGFTRRWMRRSLEAGFRDFLERAQSKRTDP